TDPDPYVRTRAVRLLDQSENPKLVAIFLDMLKNDEHVDVRAEAASVLSLFVDMGELQEIPEELYHQVEEALLVTANGRDDARVRRAALESLGYSSRAEVVTLIDSAFHREDPSWRASAIVAMGRSADDRWEDEVTTSLISEDDDVKRVAVQSAGELGLKSARLVLIRLLEEEDDAELTHAAIWSLSQIGGEDARTYIDALLNQTEEDEDQVEFLEEALDNLSFTEDLNRFELMAIDPDADLEELEEADELEEVEEDDE
ncbi:MAG: HEAT repeat domain-containing protein, partial [Chloroflexota bacterium]|nr:HEAT repeat domain-containing protein [Chloroflexota bacterium]